MTSPRSCPLELRQRFVAHRGANNESPNCKLKHLPENTLCALREAYDQGAIFVECDIHVTADNQIIVLHDETLKRTGRFNSHLAPDMTLEQFNALVERDVTTLNYDEIKHVDVGAYAETIPECYHGCGIPLLKDFLQELQNFPERRLIIEIKAGPLRVLDSLKALINSSIKEFNLHHDQLLFISFDFNLIKHCKRLLPNHRQMFLTTATPDTNDAKYDPATPDNYQGLYFRINSKKDLLPIIKIVKAANLDVIDFEYNAKTDNKSLVETLRAENLMSAVWTNLYDDTLAEAKAMLALNVELINTNQPQAVFTALQANPQDMYFTTRLYQYVCGFFSGSAATATVTLSESANIKSPR